MGSGLRQNLDYNRDFKRLPIILPPRAEQDRIVTFLDEKTAAIDDAIAKKRRLIKLLQEQKGILINTAVTQGLDPNAPMKESGVEWIGRVPAHWEVKRLKFFSAVQSGLTLGKTYSGKNVGSYPYLRVANVQYGYFKLDDVAEIRLPTYLALQYIVRSGDILVTEGGDIDKLGRGTVWEGQIDPCLHQNHIFAIRANKEIASEYFVSLVMGADYGRKYFTHTANKTTNLASTNKSKLGNFPLAIPPIDEQNALVDRANKISLEIDKLLSKVSSEVEKLYEFKSTLIAEAVTGKIKV
jgi:type I restriction enzyme, S subunit